MNNISFVINCAILQLQFLIKEKESPYSLSCTFKNVLLMLIRLIGSFSYMTQLAFELTFISYNVCIFMHTLTSQYN